ncbi:MAG: dihydropteroate synthase [Candidatus Omnitrophota bacterium]
MNRKIFEIPLNGSSLRLGETTKIMGVINVTADSFSGDGIYDAPEKARERALRMIEEGAGIIDIGGESSRPGATHVPEEEEKNRVVPVIRMLAKSVKVPISVDTVKAGVASAALDAGASIVNDISGLKFDDKMAAVVARENAGCVLMHIKGTPETMQQYPVYASLIPEIIGSLKESISLAYSAGIRKEKLIIDPGIGFGKTWIHNLQIIRNLQDFACLDLPILLGTSRKSFIGHVVDLPVQERLFPTIATVVAAVLNGAHIVRVHDVKETAQALRMTDAILNN